MDENQKDMFLALLSRKYFPRKMPPPFSTVSFGENIKLDLKNIQKNILNGLWEMIDDKQKNNIKNNLLKNIIEDLQHYIKTI